MTEFLETHGTEVANMLLSGWNMDEALAVSKEEGYEDGFEDGQKMGEMKKQYEMIRKFSKIITPEQIAETLQVSVEYVQNILNGTSMVCETEAPYVAKIKEKE